MNQSTETDIAPDEDRVVDIQEDGASPQPQRECDEVTNNVFLPSGGRFLRIIGEDHPVYVRHVGPYFEPMDETPDNEFTRVPHYSQSLIMQPQPVSYNSEQNRYDSFHNVWPYSSPVSAKDLAQAGFRYLGPPDSVKCVFCNGVLKDWVQGDNVLTEHKRHFPHCLFMQGRIENNIPISRHIATIERNIPARIETTLLRQTSGPSPQKFKHPQYCIKSARLVTFNDWPSQIKQTPEDLADAGLFYLGHGDKVKCFVCNGMLHSWEPQDEPWIEHARWFPDCEYVNLMKGKEFIEGVQSGRITAVAEVDKQNAECSINANVENIPAVKAVLDQGNTLEQIKRAFQNLGIKDKQDIPKADKILETIMKLEQNDSSSVMTKESCSFDPNPNDTDYNSLVEENRNLKEQKLCKICLENEVSVIFLPCSHICCCAECSMSVQMCPICRKDIEQRKKIFLA